MCFKSSSSIQMILSILILYPLSSLATAHSLDPSDMDLLWEQLTKALVEALNFSDSYSSSDSSDVFSSSISMSKFFSWPAEDEFDDSAEELSSSESSGKFPNVFDIFRLMKTQLGDQMSMGGNSQGRELFDLSKKIAQDSMGFDSEEPLDQPLKRINKGNFLLNPDEEEEKQVLDALNKQDINSSSTSFVVYFK